MKANNYAYLFLFLTLITSGVFAQANVKRKGKKIVKYKAYETFDFESLSLTGSLVSPGDISSKINSLREYDFDEKIRKDFDRKMVQEIFESH